MSENKLDVTTSESNDLFEIVTTNTPGKIYNIYLNGEIKYDAKVNKLLELFRSSSSTDKINFYISSPGGGIYKTFQILNAMKDCKAKIRTIADGQVASCATLIFLSAHEFEVKDLATFMIYNYTAGWNGKGHEIKSEFEHFDEMWNNILYETYGKILSKKEIKEVIDGRDIYFDSKQLLERLDKGYKKLKKKKMIKSSKK